MPAPETPSRSHTRSREPVAPFVAKAFKMSDCDDRSAAPAPKGRLAKYMRTERRRHGSDRMRDAVLALLTQGESSLCEVVKPLHRHMERYAATGRPQDALLSARRAMIQDLFRGLLLGLKEEFGIRYYADETNLRNMYVCLVDDLYVAYTVFREAEKAIHQCGKLSPNHRSNIVEDVMDAAVREFMRKADAAAAVLADRITWTCECTEDGDDSFGYAESDGTATSDDEEGETDEPDEPDECDADSSDTSSVHDMFEVTASDALVELGLEGGDCANRATLKQELEQELESLKRDSSDIGEALLELQTIDTRVQDAHSRELSQRQGKKRAIESMLG